MDSGAGQLYTWEGLLSVAQMSMLLFLIVQFSKTLIDRFFPSIPTDFYSLILGFFIVMTVQIANGANVADWKVWILGFFNTFIVVANSGYIAHKSQNPPQLKPRAKRKSKEEHKEDQNESSSFTSSSSTTITLSNNGEDSDLSPPVKVD